MRDASLDDFFGGDDEDEERETDPEVEADAEPAETEPETSESTPETDPDEDSDGDEPTLTVEAATPTYDFSPDGATCEACGETVETRWHDPDGGMVCGECKRWD
jgi:formylmethanofuran dehydrogenase subunit E